MLTMALALQAIPAKRGVWKTLTLADGTTVKAELCGDEHFSFWKTEDGACYQMKGADGHLETINVAEMSAQANESRAKANQRRATRRQGAAKAAYTGTKKCLVILVDFPDMKFQENHDQAYYNTIVNQENFTSDEGYVGSVHDYFHEQSGGVFDLTFDVVGPYTMSRSYTYYGENVEYYGQEYKDYNVSEMIQAACRAANNDVNYADYDWDGDGYVDQVYVLYAGDNEAAGASSNTIWPHESQVYGYMSPMDGKRISTYATGSEMSGYRVDGIGTFCHEFSHCLGLMDSYDTNYEEDGGTAYGMGSWDVMANGTDLGNGMIPAGYTSYNKSFCGWLTLTELTGEVQVTGMKAMSEGGEAYIIYNKSNSNEYYLLENRQRTGWDAAIPGSGLIITHVDYSRNDWQNNTVNVNPSHQRMTIFHADNSAGYGNESTDPFPYRNRNKLTNTSIPAATLFNSNSDGTKFMNYPITSITMENGLISFVGGVDAVDEDLNGPAVDPTGALLYESFDQCRGAGANDLLWEGSDVGNVSLTTDVDGWYYRSGAGAGANRCALFGTVSLSGNMASPTFTLNGSATVTFKAAAFDKENCTLTLTANGGTLSENSFELSKEAWTVCTTQLTANGEVRLVFAPSQKRFFFDEFIVMPGEESAIVSIDAAAIQSDATRIYSLDGRYAGSDASVLSPGLYIRGGKKFVVK